MNNKHLLLALPCALFALHINASAHFKLIAPQPWIAESQLGDPQKIGPCGGNPNGDNDKVLSKVVTKAVGGSKLHLRVDETIYHSGHYRVALAVNSRTELPPDPFIMEKRTDKGLYSVWAQVQSPPQIPVLADGLFPHYPKAGEPASVVLKAPLPPWESDVELPNISCPKCTLQVIQFMADHEYNQPGGYVYHHCADLEITADTAKPIDTRWPTVTPGAEYINGRLPGALGA